VEMSRPKNAHTTSAPSALAVADGTPLQVDGRAILPATAVWARVPRLLDRLDLGHGPRRLGPVGPPSVEARLPATTEVHEGAGHRVAQVVVPIVGMGDRVAAGGAGPTLQ
jgi:hypothetical protein